jgi:hypothetical protein
MFCHNIADSLANGCKIQVIIINFSKAFDLVPNYRLLAKIVASGLDWAGW